MSQQRDTPFPIIETRRSRDELANLARIFAAGARVGAHKCLAGREIEHVPVVTPGALFAHGVETHDRPVVLQFRIEPIKLLTLIAFLGRLEGLLELRRIGRVAGFSGLKIPTKIVLGRNILRQLGHTQVRKDGNQSSWRKTGLQLAVERRKPIERCVEQDETDIGLSSHVGQSHQPGMSGSGKPGGQGLQTKAHLIGLTRRKPGPADPVDAVEQMLNVNALRKGDGIHGVSVATRPIRRQNPLTLQPAPDLAIAPIDRESPAPRRRAWHRPPERPPPVYGSWNRSSPRPAHAPGPDWPAIGR